MPGKDDPLRITPSHPDRRWLFFAVWALLSVVLFAKPVADLVRLARQDETASHILLIPFICVWLLYTERTKSPAEGGFAFRPAMAFLLPAVFLSLFLANCPFCSPKDRLSIYILALLCALIAGFVLFLGVAKAKASSFALALLLLTIPIPDVILNKIIYELQSGSAAIAEIFFNLSGAPVLREGFVFHLPKMSIEVAQECSGIRSSLALFILALLVAHFSFRPFWKKAVFVCAGLCMMLIKNGIRIAALTLLANYVDPDFLYGRLHHQGGIVFFLIGLTLLLPVYWYLRKGEGPSIETGNQVVPEPAGNQD
jgi:exosortase